MSVKISGHYYFGDNDLEKCVSEDPNEARSVWGLTEDHNASISGASGFIVDKYSRIYPLMMDVLDSFWTSAHFLSWEYFKCITQSQDPENTF